METRAGETEEVGPPPGVDPRARLNIERAATLVADDLDVWVEAVQDAEADRADEGGFWTTLNTDLEDMLGPAVLGTGIFQDLWTPLVTGLHLRGQDSIVQELTRLADEVKPKATELARSMEAVAYLRHGGPKDAFYRLYAKDGLATHQCCLADSRKDVIRGVVTISRALRTLCQEPKGQAERPASHSNGGKAVEQEAKQPGDLAKPSQKGDPKELSGSDHAPEGRIMNIEDLHARLYEFAEAVSRWKHGVTEPLVSLGIPESYGAGANNLGEFLFKVFHAGVFDHPNFAEFKKMPVFMGRLTFPESVTSAVVLWLAGKGYKFPGPAADDIRRVADGLKAEHDKAANPTPAKKGGKSRKRWTRQHCPSCGYHTVEFVSMKQFSKKPGAPSYNTVRARVATGDYLSNVAGRVPWCPVCKERTPEGAGAPAPIGGPTTLTPGVEPYVPSEQDKGQMLAWARGIVKVTPGCDLQPETRLPLDSDPPAMQLGLDRLNNAVEAIMGLARELNRLPTRDEADDVAKKAISKARSHDVRISYQTDAYDKRQKKEEGHRFDGDHSQES
jgi:hypothetical protein